ncbi:MAG: Ig-like domain-containing protein [Oscillospiraceae bacterium]|nr:Ig-like domain-containing protein [Oscillospiraceae bacterium]
MKTFRKAAALFMAAAAVLSASGSCFAAEWKETDKGMTYINDSGKAVTGMQEIDGETYYFNSKGIMKTGWLSTKSGKKYYFDSDGTMRTGWLRTNSAKYYFTEKGVMCIGSVKIGTSYYFFDEDGKMLTGWQEADGEDYYYCTNGKRAVSKTVNIDGERVKFDKNGRVVSTTSSDKTEDSPAVTSVSKQDEAKEEKEVTAEKIVPREIVVTDTEFTIQKGAKFRLSYNFRPITTNCTDVTFSSSNDSVVSVNKKGDIEALKQGKATVTIRSAEDKSVSVKLKITVE